MKDAGKEGVERSDSRAVDLAGIEAELKGLWKESREAQQGVTRACVLNLIVVCEDAEPSREFATLMAGITAEHPCRVFQVLSSPGARDPSLEAEISAHCHRPAGSERQVCCEQITLRANGAATADLNGVVTPLLVSDLPVFLWWRGTPPLGEKRFMRLVDLAHRVIIDTGLGRQSVDVLAGFAAWCQGSRPARRSAAPGDLNWRRLHGWREVISSLFDAPQRRRALDNITQLHLKTGLPATGEELVAAFYLCGWLAAQLDWEIRPVTALRTSEAFRFELDAHTHVVKVAIDGSEKEAVPLRLTLQAQWEGGGLSLEAQSVSDRRVIVCRVSENEGAIVCHESDLGESAPALLMRRELEVGGRDAVYEKTLGVAGDLARLWIDRVPRAAG